MKTTIKNPFSSQQLKEMADKLEDYRVHNLSLYKNAASNTRGACESFFPLIRNDDKSRLVFCEDHYDSMVESGIKFLQERRCQEKERLEAYLETEEQAISALTMQCDKSTEERGGSTQDIIIRMVWIPPLGHYFGYADSRYKFKSS
jgi:hypothetical protein